MEVMQNLFNPYLNHKAYINISLLPNVQIRELLAKGQVISKCPFGVIVSTKIPTEKFDNFCPRI